MNKAILVMDKMPDKCNNCLLIDNREFYSPETKHWERWKCRKTCKAINIYSDTRPDWCPIKEVPEYEMIWYDDERSDYERGYNSCIDEILGME